MNRFTSFVLLLLLATTLLAACGDSTSTPAAATTVPATTAPATTAAVTTVAATTQIATTAATTQIATTAVPTTVPATTVAATTSAVTTQAANANLTFTDKSGTTITLTKSPERIVCLFSSCFDALAELGLTPVAVDMINGQVINFPHFLGDKGASVPRLGGSAYEPSLEDIAKYKPDLVIGFFGPHNTLREPLKNTAPLWLVYPNSYTESLDILRTMGRLTGRTEQANAAVKKFQDKLAAYKAKSPANKSVMVGIYDGKTFYPYVEGSILCGLLKEIAKCDWKAPTASATGVIPYTAEQLLSADPDVLFVINAGGGVKYAEALKNDTLGKGLKAVKNNQVYDADLWYQAYGTRALSLVLDQAATKLYPDVIPNPLP